MAFHRANTLSDERWLGAWEYVLNTLSRGVTSVFAESDEVMSELKRPGKRDRIGKSIDGASWANLYELSLPAQFAWSCAQIMPLADLWDTLSPLNFKKRFAELHDGTLQGSSYEPSSREMPKVLSHSHAMTAQLRALVYCGRSMSDLIRGARDGEDKDFFTAVRIDPAVVTGRFAARRIQRAVAVDERSFITQLTTALRSPIKSESHLARVNRALWFMSLTKQVHRLTEKSSAELFIHRTKLYRQHGAKDAERSLWRHIQRWKKLHATKAR